MYKEDDNVLNELISRGDCANCKICCKFEPDELIDAPTFTKKQMQYIKDNINENLNVHYYLKKVVYCQTNIDLLIVNLGHFI